MLSNFGAYADSSGIGPFCMSLPGLTPADPEISLDADRANLVQNTEPGVSVLPVPQGKEAVSSAKQKCSPKPCDAGRDSYRPFQLDFS